MAEHDHKTALLSKWALGIAQGLILAALGWFGQQQLNMHDDLIVVKQEIQMNRAVAAQVTRNTGMVDTLDVRVSSLEKRQDRDEALRDRSPPRSH